MGAAPQGPGDNGGGLYLASGQARGSQADFLYRLSDQRRLLRIIRRLLFGGAAVLALARMAAISESKLKKDFKTMYGYPIYEYYQKARMQAAQDKLLTGKFSVKEVAMELGYSNLSNFTIAFKKEFGILPSQLLSTRRPNE